MAFSGVTENSEMSVAFNNPILLSQKNKLIIF